MKRYSSTLFFGLLALGLLAASSTVAQDSAQKGQATGRLEMSQQIRAANSDSLDVKATEALRHARKKPLMTPQESTDLFLALDRNDDGFLTRSELPVGMAILRAQFDRYDGNHDHRLSYSEFANYTDVVPNELADSPH